MKKKRQGALLLEYVIYLLMAIILMISMTYYNPTKTIAQKELIEKALMLDSAISQWYISHDLEYPEKLELVVMYGGIPNTVDLKMFIYKISNDKKQYLLTVTLPDGTVYKSPNSKL